MSGCRYAGDGGGLRGRKTYRRIVVYLVCSDHVTCPGIPNLWNNIRVARLTPFCGIYDSWARPHSELWSSCFVGYEGLPVVSSSSSSLIPGRSRYDFKGGSVWQWEYDSRWYLLVPWPEDGQDNMLPLLVSALSLLPAIRVFGAFPKS